jgi:hypothetical protein
MNKEIKTSVTLTIFNLDGSVRLLYINCMSAVLDKIGASILEFIDRDGVMQSFGMDFMPEHNYFGVESVIDNVRMTAQITFTDEQAPFVDEMVLSIQKSL